MQHIGLLPLPASETHNRKKCLGRPLFCWALTQAIFSKLDSIAVATDSDWIVNFIETHYSWTDKIQLIPLHNQNQNTNQQDIVLEFLNNTSQTFETVSLLVATNPFIDSKHINKCLEAVVDGKDVARTAVSITNKIYNDEAALLTKESNLFIENSGVISTTVKSFLNANAFSNDCALIEMPKDSLHSIYEDENWPFVEQRLAQHLISKKRCKRINYLVLDVDGVFTDGGVYYDSSGEMAKRFDMRDGMGLEILREHQVEIIIMTSEDSELVRRRMQKLKINYVFLGAKDKYSLLEHFIKQENLDRSEIAYVGDDVNDLANLCSVGWSFAPKNATTNVLPLVDIVLSKPSGNGAIREVCEFLLKYNSRSHNA